MLEKLREHFSFTTPASVHDEEALTALELSGRYGKKINEIIEDQNKHREEVTLRIGNHIESTNTALKEQDGKIDAELKKFNETITKEVGELPSDVQSAVLSYINNGTFDSAIDKYAGGLTVRVNNLLGKLPEGTTASSMDGEIIDARVDYAGQTYTNIGEAFRTVTEAIYKRHRNWVTGAYGYSKFNIQPSAKKIEFGLTGSIDSTYAIFTPSAYYRMQGVSLNYSDVWGDRTSDATFVLMYERYAVGGALVMKELPVNVPDDVTGDMPILATILIKNDGSILSVHCCDDLKQILTIDGKPYIAEEETNSCDCTTVEQYNTPMIFNNILCIGDGFTSGHIESANGTQSPYNPLKSYPYYLSKLLGCDFFDYTIEDNTKGSHSFITTAARSGFAISDLFDTATAENAQRWSDVEDDIALWAGTIEAVLVGVGLNDIDKTPVGTVSDTSDMNTFCGKYRYLIESIQMQHSCAHIFFMTSPDMTWLTCPYYNAIKNVVASYTDGHVHLLDLTNLATRGLWTNNDKINSTKVGNHYTAIGYQQSAQNLLYVWGKYINEHPDNFLDVY